MTCAPSFRIPGSCCASERSGAAGPSQRCTVSYFNRPRSWNPQNTLTGELALACSSRGGSRLTGYRSSVNCAAESRSQDLGLIDASESSTEPQTQNGSATSSVTAPLEGEKSLKRSPSLEDPEATLCIMSGEIIDDPEKEAQVLQERIIKQLQIAQLVFPALALTRLADAVPEILSETGNVWEEALTLFSAVDPLLVGIFAYGTAQGLQKVLDREKRKEETVEDMRQKAMDSMLNFFERANLVVFGVVLATVSRLLIDGFSGTAEWAAVQGQLIEYATRLMEVQFVVNVLRWFELVWGI